MGSLYFSYQLKQRYSVTVHTLTLIIFTHSHCLLHHCIRHVAVGLVLHLNPESKVAGVGNLL